MSPFPRRTLVVAGILLSMAVLFVVAWYAVYILLLLFAALLGALFVRSISDALANHMPFSEKASLAITLLSILAIILAISLLLAPNAMETLAQVGSQLPSIKSRLQSTWWGGLLLRFPGAESLLQGSGSLLSRIGAMFSSSFKEPLYLLMTPIVSIFLMANPELYRSGLVRIFPIAKRDHAREVIDDCVDTLRWWILGKAIGMAFVGVVVGIGLWIIGIPLAGTLGIVAGLLDFIPNIGAIISVVPAALIAMLQEPIKAMYVIFIYTIAHSLDNYVLLPLLQFKFVRLPPALSLISQMFAGYLLGPLGLILATPFAALVLVLIKKLYIEDALGDRAEE